MDDVVTQGELEEQLGDYLTRDQYWNGVRQLATDLKGEIITRPLDVTVAVDVPPVTQISLALIAGLLVYAVIGRRQ